MQRSIDETIQMEVENLTLAYDYYWEKIIDQVYRDLLEIQLEQDPDSLKNLDAAYVDAYREKKQTPDQKFFSQEFQDIVEGGFLGAEYLFSVVMPSDIVTEPSITTSSEESMVYNWEIPGYLLDAIEGGEKANYLPDGIPELGIDAPTLVYIRMEPFRTLNSEYAIIIAADIHENVAAIKAFYGDERDQAILVFGIIMAVAIMLLSLISFFFLRYMIHKHITEPIDYLSTVAEEVMQGNLDVEIDVEEGEDFEGLKRAFKEMMLALRDMINKSMEE